MYTCNDILLTLILVYSYWRVLMFVALDCQCYSLTVVLAIRKFLLTVLNFICSDFHLWMLFSLMLFPFFKRCTEPPSVVEFAL